MKTLSEAIEILKVAALITQYPSSQMKKEMDEAIQTIETEAAKIKDLANMKIENDELITENWKLRKELANVSDNNYQIMLNHALAERLKTYKKYTHLFRDRGNYYIRFNNADAIEQITEIDYNKMK